MAGAAARLVLRLLSEKLLVHLRRALAVALGRRRLRHGLPELLQHAQQVAAARGGGHLLRSGHGRLRSEQLLREAGRPLEQSPARLCEKRLRRWQE